MSTQLILADGGGPTQSPTMKKLESFPRFKELPKEIRLQIWEYLLPGTRVVHMNPTRTDLGPVSRVWSIYPVEQDPNEDEDSRFFCPSWWRDAFSREGKICGINYGPKALWEPTTASESLSKSLTTCQESFSVITGNYVQTFGTLGTIPKTWFSSRDDTMFLSISLRHTKPGNSIFDQDHPIDFRLVEKLALGNPGFRPCSAPFVDAKAYPDFLELLSGFDNLLEVTIVDRFPPCPSYWRNTFPDLVLMDFMEVAVLMEWYQPGYDPKNDRSLQRYQETWSVKSKADFTYDKLELERQWKLAVQQGKPAIKTLPKFDRKLILESTNKEAFDQAKEDYYRQKKEYRMRIAVTSSNMAPFDVTIDSTTTVEDVAEAYRAARGLSDEACIAITCGGQRIEAGTKLLDVENLYDGDVLSVLSQGGEEFVDNRSGTDKGDV